MSGSCQQHREPLALAALGAFAEDEQVEQADLRAHLESCPGCRRELEDSTHAVAELLWAAPERIPPARLRDRVLQRTEPATRSPFELLQEARRRWMPAGDGVEIAPLWVDRERERHSVLIRMQPGAHLPAHRHAAPEECFVVAGDLSDGAVHLVRGDYVRFEAGTQHALTTRDGCTLFVTASTRDSGVSPD